MIPGAPSRDIDVITCWTGRHVSEAPSCASSAGKSSRRPGFTRAAAAAARGRLRGLMAALLPCLSAGRAASRPLGLSRSFLLLLLLLLNSGEGGVCSAPLPSAPGRPPPTLPSNPRERPGWALRRPPARSPFSSTEPSGLPQGGSLVPGLANSRPLFVYP